MLSLACSHRYSLLFSLSGLGTLTLDQGDFAGAVAPLERGLELCRTREVPFLLHDFGWALGWVDEHGRSRPTRPTRPCQRPRRRAIPVNRWPVSTLRAQGWRPYSIATWVEWCGHQQEVVLVPEGAGWYSRDPGAGRGEVADASTTARFRFQGDEAGLRYGDNCPAPWAAMILTACAEKEK